MYLVRGPWYDYPGASEVTLRDMEKHPVPSQAKVHYYSFDNDKDLKVCFSSNLTKPNNVLNKYMARAKYVLKCKPWMAT